MKIKDLSKEERKRLGIWLIALAIVAVVSGIIGYNISDSRINFKEYSEEFDRQVNEALQDYADGFMDSRIEGLTDFIFDCRPTNPEVFVWIDILNNIKGVMVKCDDDIFTLKYSVKHFGG